MSPLMIIIVIGIVILTGFAAYYLFLWWFYAYIVGSFVNRQDFIKMLPNDEAKTGYFATRSTEHLKTDLLKQRETIEETRSKVKDLQAPKNIISLIEATFMLKTYTVTQTLLEKNAANIEIVLQNRRK